MSFVFTVLTVFIIQMSAVPLVWGDEGTALPVTLPLIVAEALSKNPEIREAKEMWGEAKARVLQSSALPDPTVGVMIMGEMVETRVGPQENVFEAEQMVPFPGKLWERHRMAVQEKKAAEAKYNAVEREVKRKVSETYFDLYATDGAIRLLEEIVELLKKVEGIAESRYASASSAQRDVAKAQVEVSSALERLFMFRQQRQSLEARLKSLLARSDQTEIGTLEKPATPALSKTIEELIAMAGKDRPELNEAAALLKRDKHAKTLAKLDYIPDISVGYQYIGVGSGMTTDMDDGKDAWMVPLKITVPFWQNRLIPRILETKRTVKASEARYEQAENMAEYEVKDAYYRFTTAKQVVDLYENALIPEAELALRSDEAGYEAGRTDVLNLIDSERVYLNAKVSYFQALAEALKSYVAIERAVGVDLNTAGGNSNELN